MPGCYQLGGRSEPPVLLIILEEGARCQGGPTLEKSTLGSSEDTGQGPPQMWGKSNSLLKVAGHQHAAGQSAHEPAGWVGGWPPGG